MKIKLRDANHLKTILSQTVNLPIVQDKSGKYCVFSTDKDEDGDYRKSGFYGGKEEAINNIGCWSGFCKEGLDELIKEKDWHIVDWVVRYPEKMTHCRLMPNAMDICEKFGYVWNEGREEMLKEDVLEVEEGAFNNVKVWEKDKSTFWYFPHQAIIPVIVEETIEEMTMDEVCKALGKTIKIKK